MRSRRRKTKTGRPEAFTAARGTLDGLPVMVAVQPFDFLGGSLGMGVGEALVQESVGSGAVSEKRRLHPVRRRPAGRACRKACCR